MTLHQDVLMTDIAYLVALMLITEVPPVLVVHSVKVSMVNGASLTYKMHTIAYSSSMNWVSLMPSVPLYTVVLPADILPFKLQPLSPLRLQRVHLIMESATCEGSTRFCTSSNTISVTG